MTTTYNCQIVRKLLQHYVDGGLASGEKLAVEQHVAACRDCRRQFLSLERAILAVETMPRLAAPAVVYNRAMAGVRQAHRQRATASRRTSFFSLFAAALWSLALGAGVLLAGDELLAVVSDILEDPGALLDNLVAVSVASEWSMLMGLCLLLIAGAAVFCTLIRRELPTNLA